MFTDDDVFVIGVDTHRDTHAYAVVERATGVIVDQFQSSADGAGYRDALRRVRRAGRGGRVWAIEGTGSYGAGLTMCSRRRVSGWRRSTTPTGATRIPAARATSSTRSAPREWSSAATATPSRGNAGGPGKRCGYS